MQNDIIWVEGHTPQWLTDKLAYLRMNDIYVVYDDVMGVPADLNKEYYAHTRGNTLQSIIELIKSEGRVCTPPENPYNRPLLRNKNTIFSYTIPTALLHELNNIDMYITYDVVSSKHVSFIDEHVEKRKDVLVSLKPIITKQFIEKMYDQLRVCDLVHIHELTGRKNYRYEPDKNNLAKRNECIAQLEKMARDGIDITPPTQSISYNNIPLGAVLQLNSLDKRIALAALHLEPADCKNLRLALGQTREKFLTSLIESYKNAE